MMENYYESSSKAYYEKNELKDARPEGGYQTGILPEQQERARNHSETLNSRPNFDKPWTGQPPPLDGKWRYMWRVGHTAEMSSDILPDNVIPEDFENWSEMMESFGGDLRQCCFTAAEMLSVGFGWEQETLRSMMEGGTQLLGPTGSDLRKYNKKGDILAGFHYGKTLELTLIFRYQFLDNPR